MALGLVAQHTPLQVTLFHCRYSHIGIKFVEFVSVFFFFFFWPSEALTKYVALVYTDRHSSSHYNSVLSTQRVIFGKFGSGFYCTFCNLECTAFTSTHHSLSLRPSCEVHRIPKVHVRGTWYKALCRMCFIRINFLIIILQFTLSSIINIIIISNIYHSSVHLYLVNIREETYKPRDTKAESILHNTNKDIYIKQSVVLWAESFSCCRVDRCNGVLCYCCCCCSCGGVGGGGAAQGRVPGGG